MIKNQSCKLHAIITSINVRHCVTSIGVWVTLHVRPKLKVCVSITATVPPREPPPPPPPPPSNSRMSSSPSGRFSTAVMPSSLANTATRIPYLVDFKEWSSGFVASLILGVDRWCRVELVHIGCNHHHCHNQQEWKTICGGNKCVCELLIHSQT